jgi:hypothetical protein
MNRSLSDVFNVEPTPVYKTPVPQAVDEKTETRDDAIQIRKNMWSLIETGQDALKEALEVAIESESPRAFEVVTGLIAAMGDLNNKLLHTHKVELDIAKASGETKPVNATQNNITNNTVFVGTPAELFKALAEQKALRNE